MLSKDSKKKFVNIALCLHHRISTHTGLSQRIRRRRKKTDSQQVGETALSVESTVDLMLDGQITPKVQ